MPARNFRNPARPSRIAAVIAIGFVLLTGLITGCGNPFAERSVSAGVLPIASAFGPDGRLWRLIPASEHIYVDWSDDGAKSFSAPVQVNPEPQRIRASAEGPPTLAVDARGRVYILYFVRENRLQTTYYSVSTDRGRSFSPPRPVSDRAASALHYRDVMAVDTAGNAHVFWYDSRDQVRGDEAGLALYYARFGAEPGPGDGVNRRLGGGLCPCCRTAVALRTDQTPLVLARFVFPGNVRDHGFLPVAADGSAGPVRRLIEDDWRIDACPEQGPALAIDAHGRYHMTWFTQGSRRQGLFYAYSDDGGSTLSEPLRLGVPEQGAGHAAVRAAGDVAALAWREFDGERSRVRVMLSADRGETWSAPRLLGETRGRSDYPRLLDDGQRLFLAWTTAERGYGLWPLEPPA